MHAWASCVAPHSGRYAIHHAFLEHAVFILFIHLYELFEKALDRAEHSRRDAYLASAADIGELERRMHGMEI